MLEDDDDLHVLLTHAPPAPAKIFHRKGLNISLRSTYGEILGDLDGGTFFQNNTTPPDEFIFLPDADASAGLGVDIGMRWERYEMLFSWQETTYDANYLGAGKDTTIRNLDLFFRRYFWIDSRVQPFLIAGLGMSEGNISGGAQDSLAKLSTGELQDGINASLGGGLALYVMPSVSVFGQWIYRFGRFQAIDAGANSVSADSAIDSDAWEFSLGATLHLLDPWE